MTAMVDAWLEKTGTPKQKEEENEGPNSKKKSNKSEKETRCHHQVCHQTSEVCPSSWPFLNGNRTLFEQRRPSHGSSKASF
mmetsp:Transcript_71647/g.149772  ORF Transcript_71647/g.149772 Transcript_71647/m.149772 type:complete len:81 (+) Transcript_71647:429-671(+)